MIDWTEGSLSAICGSFGSGKGLLSAQKIWEAYQFGGRRLLITNFGIKGKEAKELMPDLTIERKTNLEMATFWRWGSRGAIVLVDEAQLVWATRQAKQILTNDRMALEYISELRHTKDIVYVVSQSWGDFVDFLRVRIQHCTQTYKLPLPFVKIFMRTDWVCGGGKRQQLIGFSRFLPFSALKRYADIYDTHYLSGSQGDRPLAPMVEPSTDWRWVTVFAASPFLLAGLFFYWKWYGPMRYGKAATPSVVAVAGAKSGRVSDPVVVRRPLGVSPAELLKRGLPRWNGDEYIVGQGYTVLGVGDSVRVGNNAGGVCEYPRDYRSEYASIRSQRETQGGNFVTGTSGLSAGMGNRSGNFGRPDTKGVRAGASPGLGTPGVGDKSNEPDGADLRE